MASPHLRTAAVSPPYQATYTLGGTERFRLDSVTWTQAITDNADVVIPTLEITDRDGTPIATCQTSGTTAPFPPTLDDFLIGGPASFNMPVTLAGLGTPYGYTLHDFGAAVTTSDMAIFWTQPPGLFAEVGVLSLPSAGAVTLGGEIAEGDATLSTSVTAPLFLGAAAGDTLLVMLTSVTSEDVFGVGVYHHQTATTNVAGNTQILNPNGATSAIPAVRHTAAGYWFSIVPIFMSLTNPMVAGDTVTVSIPGVTLDGMHLSVSTISGITGNPYTGPNPGGNIGNITTGAATAPIVITALAPPATAEWTGGVLVYGAYEITPDAVMDVSLARGAVANLPVFGIPTLPTRGYAQATLPELYLEPLCTITATSLNESGQPRVFDVLSDVLIWAIDEA